MTARQTRDHNGLPVDCRDTFDELVEILGRKPRTLADGWEAGRLIAAIQDATAGYGKGWAQALCAELVASGQMMSKSLLYKLLKAAKVFSQDDIEQFGSGVCWEAAVLLIPIKDRKTRTALLKTILNEKTPPSTRRVRALVREHVGYKKPHGGRRPAGPSSDPSDALRTLRDLADGWPAVYQAWTKGPESALDKASRLKPDEVGDAFIDEIKWTAANVEKMAEQAARLSARLKELQKSIGRKGGID